MATDIARVIANLMSVCDLTRKCVIEVGAGGGQFVGYTRQARHVLAIDPDADAVTRLRTAIESQGATDRFTVRQADFESIDDRADVVFFEFCLHEMAAPDAALGHARRLAPEILVVDHVPESSWAWYTAETEKARNSWAAVEAAGIRISHTFVGRQLFANTDALVTRLAQLGEPAVGRARALGETTDIDIEMIYRVAVL